MATWSRASKLITTPIFYINASPHLGHLYTVVLADVLKRFALLRFPQTRTWLSTGTDEHGLKVEKAARLARQEPGRYADHISSVYRDLFDQFSVSHDDFIRTSSARHQDAVSAFWKRLADADAIYEGHYAGWYCVADEAFYDEAELAPGGLSPTGHVCEYVRERNYMFRLSLFTERIREWLPTALRPVNYLPPLQQWLQKGLRDISISRPAERLQWALPVPGDASQKVYVWLDALVNYLTVTGFPDNMNEQLWPPTLQIVGKDILKFHCVYWPAFLLAAGVSLPSRLLCHGHWTVDGEKMSKSKGNVVDPLEEVKHLGGSTDALRFVLLRYSAPQGDCSYSRDGAVALLNSELANTIGNLLSRCLHPKVNPAQMYPKFDRLVLDNRLVDAGGPLLEKQLHDLPALYERAFANDLHPQAALQHVLDVMHTTNAFYQHAQVWKHMDDCDYSETVNAVACEALRLCGVLLQPFVPSFACRLLDSLGVGMDERSWSHTKVLDQSIGTLSGRTLPQNMPKLFQRLKDS